MESGQFRFIVANLALFIFVFSTSLGFFLWDNWTGFVALGVTSGIAALFLGADNE